MDAVLGQELFDEFQRRFLTFDQIGPKVKGGSIDDSEETNITVTTLSNGGFCFDTGIEHIREVGWSTDKGDIHMKGLTRDEAFRVIGRSSMKLGHLGFFAKWTAKVDSCGRDIGDAVNALTSEIEGAGTTMAVTLVPEFKVL